MDTARLWFARLVLGYAALIFCFLAYLYIAAPLEHIASFGISATGSPESVNFLRAGPGALFAGMALTAVHGLARPGLMLRALWILVVFNGAVVAVRLLGLSLEGVTDLQLRELRDEGISWLFFVAAWVFAPRNPEQVK